MYLFFAFVLMSSTTSQASLWREHFTCEADATAFPLLGKVTTAPDGFSYQMRNAEPLEPSTFQHPSRKVQGSAMQIWKSKTDEVELAVSLKPSSWGDYHTGTLSFLTTKVYVPLWCYPRMDVE